MADMAVLVLVVVSEGGEEEVEGFQFLFLPKAFFSHRVETFATERKPGLTPFSLIYEAVNSKLDSSAAKKVEIECERFRGRERFRRNLC